MVFSSFEFLVFVSIFLMVFGAMRGIGGRFFRPSTVVTYLLVISVWFYGQWGWRDLGVLTFSAVVNFGLGRLLTDSTVGRGRSLFLGIGLCANLLLLGYFKYGDLFSLPPLEGNMAVLSSSGFLPLGISFYTFQQVAYLVDCYRDHRGRYRFSEYACFVSFFPQLIAGPIVKHRDLIPQFQNGLQGLNYVDFLARGVALFAFGLCKKTVLADGIAPFVDESFAHAIELSSPEASIAILAYAAQLYFDFSGYCDMALGLGLMFGIRLPINFNSPYRARNVVKFWGRWNITLGAFFRDYLFRPLGGFSRKQSRRVLVLLLTMTLTGLWHGSTWLFAVWGFVHGLALLLARWWQGKKWSMPQPVAVALTFSFVVLSLVFFRAENWGQAMTFYHAILAGGLGWPHFLPEPAAWLGVGEPVVWFSFLRNESKEFFMGLLVVELALIFGYANSNAILTRERWDWWLAIKVTVALLAGVMSISGGKEFIYFVF